MKINFYRRDRLSAIRSVEIACASSDGDTAELEDFDTSGFLLAIEEQVGAEKRRAVIKVSAADALALGKFLVEHYGNDA